MWWCSEKQFEYIPLSISKQKKTIDFSTTINTRKHFSHGHIYICSSFLASKSIWSVCPVNKQTNSKKNVSRLIVCYQLILSLRLIHFILSLSRHENDSKFHWIILIELKFFFSHFLRWRYTQCTHMHSINSFSEMNEN